MSLPIKIDLPGGFLDEEVRCGYTITPKLKKIWAVELDLMSEFARVCDKYDIKWSVAFGTMLGAIRHKGFIPWDDDVDVMLERKEFEKLVQVAPKEFKHPYFFQYALNECKEFMASARLRNSLTTGYVRGSPKEGYNNGIYIDIDIMDANPQSRIKYLWKHFLKRITAKLLGIYYQNYPIDKSCAQRLMFMFKPIAHLWSYERLWKWYCSALSLFNDSETHYSHMLGATLKGRSGWISRENLKDTILLPYEFMKASVIKDYDHYLKNQYGDYMSFPPPEQRGKWHEGIIHFEPEIPYEEHLLHKEKSADDGK